MTPGGANTYFFADVWIDPSTICTSGADAGADFAVITRKLVAGETVPNPQDANDISFTVAVP